MDNDGVCRCDDGAEYVLKSERAHLLTPHNEWFSTHLASAVNIACPPCAVIEDEYGKPLFGSRWEGGVASGSWLGMVLRGEIDKPIIAGTLSRILAFDHFIYNDDRHLGNYLVRDTRNGWIMLAMDFSRSWSFHGFPPYALPFPIGCNTRKWHREIKSQIGDFVEIDEVNGILDKLRSIRFDAIENILDKQPASWLTKAKKRDIVTWWKSANRSSRIDAIRKGIGNGSYL